MSFNYRVLNLESIIEPSKELKDNNPKEAVIERSLKKSIIEIWFKNGERFLLWDGVRYKVTETGESKD